MNPVIDRILNHRSIRKFSAEEIPETDLNLILEAATAASSSGNMQSYSIIVTKDGRMKQKLYEPHFKQSMILDAPVFLTFCADFHRMRSWLKVSQAPDNFDNYMSFMIASIDAILASQNAALAAEELGYGICYLGTTLASAHEIGEILGCPVNVVPVVGFALGNPAEKPEKKDRLPLDAIVHYETYRPSSGGKIKQVYADKETKGMMRYREIPELKQLIEKASAKNLAQIYTKVKYTKESHQKYSADLLHYLKSQNFLEGVNLNLG
jgi:nitroreductase